VGASWREVSKEKAELNESYAQLQHQYAVAEERLLDLAAAAHQSELELSAFKGSWLWRVYSFFSSRISRGQRGEQTAKKD
jgi:hypothetical protein